MRITIHGLASGKNQILHYSSEELNEVLMDWLRKNNITIASSCGGEGICRKCFIQNDWLTCQLTLKEFLQSQPDGRIDVSYL